MPSTTFSNPIETLNPIPNPADPVGQVYAHAAFHARRPDGGIRISGYHERSGYSARSASHPAAACSKPLGGLPDLAADQHGIPDQPSARDVTGATGRPVVETSPPIPISLPSLTWTR